MERGEGTQEGEEGRDERDGDLRLSSAPSAMCSCTYSSPLTSVSSISKWCV